MFEVVAGATTELFKGGTSDHSAQIIRLRELEGSKRQFRIFNSWLNRDDVIDMVREAWSPEITGNPLFRVISKLKRVKLSIKRWALNQGDPRKRTQGFRKTQGVMLKGRQQLTNRKNYESTIILDGPV